ncbi:MAG: restriction endonuclease subunit S [Candidatus Obscuribacterales bacterium]|nr:restriction endonuclease subunit S [Candidatus Obscuribacterales bacterium]
MSGEIPNGWIELKLGDIIKYGQTTKVEPSHIPDEAWVLELEDIEKDSSKILQYLSFAQRKSKSTKNAFQKGDVLYGKLRPYLNKVLIAPESGFCSTEIVPLKTNGLVHERYLFYWLKHPAFLSYVKDVSHGINMPRLGTEAGKNAPFILAPLKEQKRIADKLDALLARVDDCRTRFINMASLLDVLRRSIIAAAVAGDLTERWREVTRDRSPLTLASLGTWDAKKVRQKKVATAGETLVLPDGWISPFVGQVASLQPGYAFKSQWFEKAGVRLLRGTNIVPGSTRWDDSVFIAEERGVEFDDYRLTQGDIVIAMDRPLVSAGLKIAKITASDIPALLLQRVGRFMILERLLVAEYLFLYLQSPLFINHVSSQETGTQLPHISQLDIESAVIPLPSIKEQVEIARVARLVLEGIEVLNKVVLENKIKMDNLEQSILCKAFSGELVSQDPADEPASKLVARFQQTTQNELKDKSHPLRKSKKQPALVK